MSLVSFAVDGVRRSTLHQEGCIQDLGLAVSISKSLASQRAVMRVLQVRNWLVRFAVSFSWPENGVGCDIVESFLELLMRVVAGTMY